MREVDDEQRWIQRSRDGDGAAFAPLVANYQRMIHALTYRMTGSLADAEDLAQEIFIRAYRQLGSYRGEAKFSSWLYRIGINTCLNWKKSEARREQRQQEWSEQPRPGDVDEAMIDRVQAALMKLHPKQRAAIILTVYDGLNHAEAGRVLGCSETTVSWRVHRARKSLKQWLQP